jgi:hypothetical protein
MKNGAPRGPKEGFGGLPTGRPWTAKGWPRTSFSFRENDSFRKTYQNHTSDMKKRETKSGCASSAQGFHGNVPTTPFSKPRPGLRVCSGNIEVLANRDFFEKCSRHVIIGPLWPLTELMCLKPRPCRGPRDPMRRQTPQEAILGTRRGPKNRPKAAW